MKSHKVNNFSIRYIEDNSAVMHREYFSLFPKKAMSIHICSHLYLPSPYSLCYPSHLVVGLPSMNHYYSLNMDGYVDQINLLFRLTFYAFI